MYYECKFFSSLMKHDTHEEKTLTSPRRDVITHQNVNLRHATSSITVLGAKLFFKYNEAYFKYSEYGLFPNYPSSTMHLNLKVSSDRNNAYEVLFYVLCLNYTTCKWKHLGAKSSSIIHDLPVLLHFS
jgi:hypothetical protein